MGEVLAGILLGPTLLGAVWPEVQGLPLPARHRAAARRRRRRSASPSTSSSSGWSSTRKILRDRIGQAAFISNASVAFPMALGFLVALPVYELLAPDVRYLPVRALHGRRDVDHRLPRARADPDRAADAEAAGRRAGDGAAPRSTTSPRGACSRSRPRSPAAATRLARARRWSALAGAVHARRCCCVGRRLLGRVSQGLRRGRPRADAAGSASSSSACCCRRSSRSRSGSRRSSAPS